jgi:hypothetical protein
MGKAEGIVRLPGVGGSEGFNDENEGKGSAGNADELPKPM